MTKGKNYNNENNNKTCAKYPTDNNFYGFFLIECEQKKAVHRRWKNRQTNLNWCNRKNLNLNCLVHSSKPIALMTKCVWARFVEMTFMPLNVRGSVTLRENIIKYRWRLILWNTESNWSNSMATKSAHCHQIWLDRTVEPATTHNLTGLLEMHNTSLNSLHCGLAICW